jgi:hypothetical protein
MEIVRVEAVVTKLLVPLQADVVALGMESPLGSTSVKEMPD